MRDGRGRAVLWLPLQLVGAGAGDGHVQDGGRRVGWREGGEGAGSREDHTGQSDGGGVKAEKKKAMDPDKPNRSQTGFCPTQTGTA